MATKTTETGIYINGKAQMIEMLQLMRKDERDRILKHVRIKNPTLAAELEEKSFSFQDLFRLPEEHLFFLIKSIKAPIMGIALKKVPADIQRKVLSMAPREYAEDAFSWLTRPLNDEKRDIERAQEKIIEASMNFKRMLQQTQGR